MNSAALDRVFAKALHVIIFIYAVLINRDMKWQTQFRFTSADISANITVMTARDRTTYIDISIFLSSFFLFAFYFYLRSGMPDFQADSAYSVREHIYSSYMRVQFLLLIPASVLLAYFISSRKRSETVIFRIASRIDTLPESFFQWMIPVFFSVTALITAKWLIGASPRVLDSFNYLFQAENFSRLQIYAKVPPEAHLFRFPFVIMQDGKWYGSVYPGFSVLLAVGVLVGKPWIVNPVLGGIGLKLVFNAGKVFFSESIARRAVLLLCLSPFYRLMSAIYMSHVSAMIWTLAAIVLLWEWFKQEKESTFRFPVGAAFAMGMAYITRPQAAAVVITPFAVYGATVLIQRKLRIRHVVVFILILTMFYIALAEYNFVLTGDPNVNPRYLVDPGRRLGFGSDLGVPLPGGKRSGHSVFAGVKNIGTLMRLWNSDMFGWGAWNCFGLITLFVAISILLPPRSKIEILLFSGIFLNFILYLFYFTPSPNFGPRYVAENIPATTLLFLVGVRKFSGILSHWKFLPSKSEVFIFSMAVILMIITVAIHLPVHVQHYGILPEMLDRSIIPDVSDSEAIILIPARIYRMNVFTWNSPDLDGIIFLRDPGVAELQRLSRAFPGHEIYRMTYGDGHWNLQKVPIPTGMN